MKTLHASEISKLPDGLYRADHSLYLLVRGASRSENPYPDGDRDLSEKALSHKLGRNDVEAAYLRTDLFKQRAPLMQAWADALLPL